MDEVFGSENFVSQIVVRRRRLRQSAGDCPRRACRLHPLVRARTSSSVKYRQLFARKMRWRRRGMYTASSCRTGRRRDAHAARSRSRSLPDGRAAFSAGQPHVADGRVGQTHGIPGRVRRARRYRPASRRAGRRTETGMERLAAAGRSMPSANTLALRPLPR